jgi:hypothetical protein
MVSNVSTDDAMHSQNMLLYRRLNQIRSERLLINDKTGLQLFPASVMFQITITSNLLTEISNNNSYFCSTSFVKLFWCVVLNYLSMEVKSSVIVSLYSFIIHLSYVLIHTKYRLINLGQNSLRDNN